MQHMSVFTGLTGPESASLQVFYGLEFCINYLFIIYMHIGRPKTTIPVM